MTSLDTDHPRHGGAGTEASDLRPLRSFVLVALPMGWLMLSLPLVLDLPAPPFLLATNVVGLLAPALVLTARGPEGMGGVRRLLAQAIRPPRPVWWVLAAFVVPGLAWVVAGFYGAASPVSGPVLAGFAVELLASAFIINIWEEVAWTGFVQRRAAARWGALRGAAATGGLFAGIHLPLAFYDTASAGGVLLGVGLLVVTGFGLRLMIAGVDSWSGGSLLTVGLVHSSFNATRGLVDTDHDWVRLAVTLVVGLLVAVALAHRHQVASTARSEREARPWPTAGSGTSS